MNFVCFRGLLRGFFILTSFVAIQGQQSQIPNDLSSLRKQRTGQLQAVYRGTRADLQKIADATILSEQAIRDAAQKEHVSATEQEVKNFLVPMLTKQGLVDPSTPIDFSAGGNLNRWLDAQQWSVDQLLKSSETLLLWVKLAVRNTVVSDSELKQFARDHSEIYDLPARVQLSLTTFQRPAAAQSLPRGLAISEALSPRIPLNTRGQAADVLKLDALPDLQLFLDINAIDPKLRKHLEGKKPGNRFGPIALQDGTIVAGTVASIKPAVNLSTSPEFWGYCAIIARLSKANQKDEFEKLTRDYVNGITNPAVRGLFGDLLGVVGTGVGALFGGVGAPVGGALGTVLGGWIDGQVSSPQPGGPTMPPQFQGFPQAQPFLQPGPPPGFPPPFQGFPQPPPLPFIPPMPQAYGGGLHPSLQSDPSFAAKNCDVDSHSAWYKNSVWSPPSPLNVTGNAKCLTERSDTKQVYMREDPD
jgi:hypothetical protein